MSAPMALWLKRRRLQASEKKLSTVSLLYFLTLQENKPQQCTPAEFVQPQYCFERPPLARLTASPPPRPREGIRMGFLSPDEQSASRTREMDLPVSSHTTDCESTPALIAAPQPPLPLPLPSSLVATRSILLAVKFANDSTTWQVSEACCRWRFLRLAFSRTLQATRSDPRGEIPPVAFVITDERTGSITIVPFDKLTSANAAEHLGVILTAPRLICFGLKTVVLLLKALGLHALVEHLQQACAPAVNGAHVCVCIRV
jgi:hypothetical protein